MSSDEEGQSEFCPFFILRKGTKLPGVYPSGRWTGLLGSRSFPVWLIAFISLACAVPVLGQSLPSAAEAKGMLERAFIAMNLRKPASPPFHMLARVHYEVDGKVQDGTYELQWAASQHYRETFEIGGDEEVDVALDDKMHVSRSSVAIALPFRNVREVLKSPVPGDLMVDLDIAKISTEQVDGAALTCVHAAKRDPNTKQHATELVCFDPGTKALMSISAEGNLENRPTNFQLKSFKTLGVKRYPMHMTSFAHPANVRPVNIEVTVDTLENVSKFPDGTFDPPPNSISRDWCLTLSSTLSMVDANEPSFTQSQLDQLNPFLVTVGPDGRVKQSDPIGRALNRENEDKVQSWLKMARFPIQSCGNKPVEYETFYAPELKVNY